MSEIFLDIIFNIHTELIKNMSQKEYHRLYVSNKQVMKMIDANRGYCEYICFKWNDDLVKFINRIDKHLHSINTIEYESVVINYFDWCPGGVDLKKLIIKNQPTGIIKPNVPINLEYLFLNGKPENKEDYDIDISKFPKLKFIGCYDANIKDLTTLKNRHIPIMDIKDPESLKIMGNKKPKTLEYITRYLVKLFPYINI